ncbi:hypothetical protein PV326_013493 [Microctonus aethiopoides]|nr:hypothetical protein PV326_013493 [Microctonus aethiopoides]
MGEKWMQVKAGIRDGSWSFVKASASNSEYKVISGYGGEYTFINHGLCTNGGHGEHRGLLVSRSQSPSLSRPRPRDVEEDEKEKNGNAGDCALATTKARSSTGRLTGKQQQQQQQQHH